MSLTSPFGYRTQSEDTSYETELFLFQRWRTMDPVEKAALVGEASVALRELALAGMEHRHPGAGRQELELRALGLFYGKEVVRTLLGVELSDEGPRSK